MAEFLKEKSQDGVVRKVVVFSVAEYFLHSLWMTWIFKNEITAWVWFYLAGTVICKYNQPARNSAIWFYSVFKVIKIKSRRQNGVGNSSIFSTFSVSAHLKVIFFFLSSREIFPRGAKNDHQHNTCLRTVWQKCIFIFCLLH